MSVFKAFKKDKKEEAAASSKNEVNLAKPSGDKRRVFLLGKTVLKKPFLSEKANILNQYNKHVFLVDISANKPAIKKEIEKRYGVAAASVNIIRNKGKTKRFRNKFGRRPNFKKAVVTLKAGHKIEIGI